MWPKSKLCTMKKEINSAIILRRKHNFPPLFCFLDVLYVTDFYFDSFWLILSLHPHNSLFIGFLSDDSHYWGQSDCNSIISTNQKLQNAAKTLKQKTFSPRTTTNSTRVGFISVFVHNLVSFSKEKPGIRKLTFNFDLLFNLNFLVRVFRSHQKEKECCNYCFIKDETWMCNNGNSTWSSLWGRCDASSFSALTSSHCPLNCLLFLKLLISHLFSGSHGVHVSKWGSLSGPALPPVRLGLQLRQWAGRTGPGGVQRREFYKRWTFLLARHLLLQSSENTRGQRGICLLTSLLLIFNCVVEDFASF